MSNGIQLFKNALASDMPKEEKTAIQRMVDRVSNGAATNYLARSGKEISSDQARASIGVCRQIGESLVVGAGLGAVDSAVGLDIKKIPIDGVAAVLGALGSIITGGSSASVDLSNLAGSASTVYAFRHTKLLMGEKRKVSGTAAKVAGDDEDVVVAAARKLRA
jgi:hypothetical protein